MHGHMHLVRAWCPRFFATPVQLSCQSLQRNRSLCTHHTLQAATVTVTRAIVVARCSVILWGAHAIPSGLVTSGACGMACRGASCFHALRAAAAPVNLAIVVRRAGLALRLQHGSTCSGATGRIAECTFRVAGRGRALHGWEVGMGSDGCPEQLESYRTEHMPMPSVPDIKGRCQVTTELPSTSPGRCRHWALKSGRQSWGRDINNRCVCFHKWRWEPR